MNKTWLMIGALILVLAICAMVSLRWLHLQDENGKTTITIDRNEMKQDVEKALGEGKSLLRDTEKKLWNEKDRDAPQPKD